MKMPNSKGNIEHPRFAPRWTNIPTAAVRVPEKFQQVLVELARQLDSDRISLEQLKEFIEHGDRLNLTPFLDRSGDDWVTEDELRQMTLRELRDLCSRTKNFRSATHAELVQKLTGKVRRSDLCDSDATAGKN